MKPTQRKCMRCKEHREVAEFAIHPTTGKRRRICIVCEAKKPNTQTCTQCEKEQALGEFWVLDTRDGTRSKVCKTCSKKNLQRRLGKRKTDDQIAEERERARQEWIARGHDALAANRAAAGSSRAYQEAR